MPVLNDADKLYLGNTAVDAVYVGGELVWPPPMALVPDDIAGLGLWLSARNLHAANGSNVTLWPDTSGAHRDATLVGAVAPTYDTSTGATALSFTGQDHRMKIAGFGTALSGRSQYTLFQRVWSNVDNNYPIVLTAPTTGPWDFITEFNSDGGVFWGHGNGCYRCSTPTTTGAWHVLSFVMAPAGPHFYVDGVETLPGFYGPNGDMQPTVPSLGADVFLGAYWEGSFGLDGLMSDTLWYDHALTNAERAGIEGWLSTPPPPALFDPATTAYMAATGLDPSYAPTLDALVVGLKTAGLWSKMRAIYPFIGGTAALHRWNLLDPRDTDDAYRLTYTGGTHSAALGYRPNEQGQHSNGNYADSHFIPLGTLDQDSTHLSMYSLQDVPPSSSCDYGCFNWTGTLASRFHVIARYEGVNAFYYGMSEEGTTNVGVPQASGLFVATRTGPTSQSAYRNGVLLQTSTAPSISLPPVPVWVGGIDTFSERSDLPFGFASIGSGLTAQNVADLYAVVQQYQTALGRQV